MNNDKRYDRIEKAIKESRITWKDVATQLGTTPNALYVGCRGRAYSDARLSQVAGAVAIVCRKQAKQLQRVAELVEIPF